MEVSFLFADNRAFLRKPGTWIIKSLDGGPAGHVALCVKFGGDDWVFESVLPKSRVLRLSEWEVIYETRLRYTFVVPNSIEWNVMQWLESMLNRPYSLAQIILIGLTNIFLPLQFLLRGTILNHERALVCTELLSRFACEFMGYAEKKKHDQFGVKDAFEMVQHLQAKAVWKA